MPGLGAFSPALLAVSKVDSSSSSMALPLALAITLGLSLLLVGLALIPLRVLPRPVQAVTYDRREPFLYTGIVIYITTGLSLAIALFMS
jgi:hypothetical protein